MKKNSFPPGWDEERVQRVLAHYEEQTEAEAVAEDEAAFEDRTQTVMGISVRTWSFCTPTDRGVPPSGETPGR